MSIVNWHVLTSAEFVKENAVESALYFLTDTHEIYRGAVPFTESVVLYTDEPTVKALNRLYINSATLEGKIWNGSTWIQVIKPLADTVTADGVNPVSGAAVASFVSTELAKVNASKDLIHSLTWDAAEHMLTATMADGKTSQEVVFDGLGVSLSAATAEGKTAIQLLDASGNKIGDAVNIDVERFVTGGEYDPESKSIILYFDGKTGDESTDKVVIPAGDLVDVYTVESTGSVEMTMAENKISAIVKISAADGNSIVMKEDGIYFAAANVDLSGVMSKVEGAVEGNIAIFGTDGQVVDSGKTLSDLATAPTLYQGATLEEAVGGATPKNGDMAVVSVAIGASDKVQKTAYFFNGTDWVAFDGNYSAENVYFPENLLTTSAIGNITLTNGQATIAAAGKNLKEVWNTIFVKEKNPTATAPAVTLTASQNKAYEVGTTVTPTFSATLSSGSYTYGPATGVIATGWEVTDTAGNTATAASGTFPEVVVADDTNYTITAKATHGEGAIPVTNTGNEYPAVKIAAGTKSKTSAAITGYRNGFYGSLISKEAAIDSALIRGLSNKTNAKPAAGNKWNVSVPAGTMRVVFAYPASLAEVSSVKDKNASEAECKSSWALSTVDVEGANGAAAIAYKVYVLDYAEPASAANTYIVTL